MEKTTRWFRTTRWFSVTGGITKVDLDTTEFARGEAFRLQINTELFRAGAKESVFKQEEIAIVSDKGLESFGIIETAEGFRSQTQGTREGDSMVISVNSDGVKGSLTFDVKTFDLSTYELLLLERSDLSDLAQEPFRLFDPEDVEIYLARLQTTGQVLNVNGRRVKVQQIILNVEGSEFRMVMTQDGEILALRSREFNLMMATESQIRERRQLLTSKAA